MSGKFEEIMAASKLSELLQKKDEDHTKKVIVWVLAIIGAVAAVAAIGPDNLMGCIMELI